MLRFCWSTGPCLCCDEYTPSWSFNDRCYYRRCISTLFLSVMPFWILNDLKWAAHACLRMCTENLWNDAPFVDMRIHNTAMVNIYWYHSLVHCLAYYVFSLFLKVELAAMDIDYGSTDRTCNDAGCLQSCRCIMLLCVVATHILSFQRCPLIYPLAVCCFMLDFHISDHHHKSYSIHMSLKRLYVNKHVHVINCLWYICAESYNTTIYNIKVAGLAITKWFGWPFTALWPQNLPYPILWLHPRKISWLSLCYGKSQYPIPSTLQS